MESFLFILINGTRTISRYYRVMDEKTRVDDDAPDIDRAVSVRGVQGRQISIVALFSSENALEKAFLA